LHALTKLGYEKGCAKSATGEFYFYMHDEPDRRLDAVQFARARAYCTRMVGDCHRAEDLVQDAWMRVMQAEERYQEKGAFLAYFMRILTNVCLSEMSRRSRQRIVAAVPENVPAEAGPVGELLEQGENAAFVRAALEQLPPRHKVAIILREVEGCSFRHIAELLDITETHAATIVYRALDRLRALCRRRQQHEA
jgi:RNA polymerase sigma-70 factor, ECF subfamily